MLINHGGAILIPGNGGIDCPAYGINPDIECGGNECDYGLCCWEEYPRDCRACQIEACPRAGKDYFAHIQLWF